MALNDKNLTLYTYFRSSCSARLRIALNLKGLSYQSIYVNLLRGEQGADEYNEVNPSHFVPTLIVQGAGCDLAITQSLAALEYLEETFPDKTPLLPADAAKRASARALANVIACDTQPVTNLRILQRIGSLGGSKETWARELMTDGLCAYEKLAEKTAGRFSVGDSPSVADVCLVPAVWGALRFGVDVAALNTVQRVYDAMMELDAVKQAHWKAQADTPEELRG